jgi:AcrR family transcriptional regulator
MAAKRAPLGRENWLQAARAALIAGGVDAVKVDRLARRLRMTRGSFYWHFDSRADLLRELLRHWEATNTAAFQRLLKAGNSNGVTEFLAVVDLWMAETDFSPAFDTAVRDWARVSREARAAVRRVDAERIGVLHRIFLDLGFPDPEAFVRARITYFHQIGYYTLDVRESPEERQALVPVYVRILAGCELPAVDKAQAAEK